MTETAEQLQPGAALRQAREARGLSVQQAAEALFLSAAAVRALEAEQWAQLPAPVFVRGYIRAYARLLALQQDALVQAYDALSPTSTATAAADEAAQWGSLDKLRFRRLGLMWAIILLLLVGVGAALIWWANPSFENGGGAPQAPTQPIAAAPESAPPSAQMAGDAEPAAQAAPRGQSGEGESGLDGGPGLPSLAEPAPPAGRPPSVNGLPSGPQLLERHLRITTDGDDELELAFVEKSWVEVRNTDAVQLYAAEGRQGELWRLDGQGPFHVVLGYAPGVTLRFNGEPVSLRQHTAENQVASLVLGR